MTVLLVFGAAGQIGGELLRRPAPGWQVIGRTHAQVSITDPGAVAHAITETSPAVVVNAAAYTAVDKAESEPAAAHRVNAVGAGTLAAACALVGVPLIHLSTDYVFDGTKVGPYAESDPIAPLGAYGASKAAGETAVRAAHRRHVILRTAWVFGALGHNFVKTMLRVGQERPEARVVDDQRGGPTAAADIADACVAIAQALAAEPGGQRSGTYHYGGAPAVSWADFAAAIFAEATRHGRKPPLLTRITTADYPTPARRPANSVLDCGAIGRAFGLGPPDWRKSLAAVVDELLGPPSRETQGERP